MNPVERILFNSNTIDKPKESKSNEIDGTIERNVEWPDLPLNPCEWAVSGKLPVRGSQY
jgi:hypothetical protein